MTMKQSSNGGLVYSTEGGRMCPDAGGRSRSVCARRRPRPRGDGVVRVSRQTKGQRGGKSVTLIKGLALDPIALALLGKQLRQRAVLAEP